MDTQQILLLIRLMSRWRFPLFHRRYTTHSIKKSLEEVSVKTEAYFTYEMKSGRLLPFQRISSVWDLQYASCLDLWNV